MSATEYAISVIVENYGPIGVFAAALWLRQSRIIAAIVDLAKEHDDVNEERIEDRVRFRND